jgi:hypothetical protein
MAKFEKVRDFLDWVAYGKLIFDLVVAVIGAKISKALLVSFTKIPEIWRSPIEWSIGALILGILLLLGRNLGRKPQPTTAESMPPESYQPPPWEGYESEEAWQSAIAAQNKLIDLGRSVEGLFTPLQLDAFRLAKQIREFLKALGPRPDVDWTGVSTSEEIAKRFPARRAVQLPWESQLTNGYQLRFSEEVRKMMLRLGEAGVKDSYKLQSCIDGVRWEKNIEDAARTLESMAIEIGYMSFVGDSGKDTRRKVDLMTAGDFKKMVENADMFLWIGTQIGEEK